MANDYLILRKEIDELQQALMLLENMDISQNQAINAINVTCDYLDKRICMLETKHQSTVASISGISLIFILCLTLALVRSRKATTQEVEK